METGSVEPERCRTGVEIIHHDHDNTSTAEIQDTCGQRNEKEEVPIVKSGRGNEIEDDNICIRNEGKHDLIRQEISDKEGEWNFCVIHLLT